MAGRKDSEGEDSPRAKVAEFAAAGHRKGCPICGRPVAKETRPFCSKRCADVDLARWFRGDYRVPTQEPPEGEEPPADAGERPDDA